MIKYEKRVLDNGLTVLAHTDNSTPMAAVNLLYKVGSRNENPDRTGFAHLFEHLMFAGSLNIPDFDTPVQLCGGENNAFTNNDYTNYYIALPKDNIETALWLESDRMQNLTISADSLAVQQRVVVEEFSQRYLNQPYGDVWLLLRPLCYNTHPYQWATIGKSPEHIKEATLSDVQQFYAQHYSPDNAILAIGAAMSSEEIFSLAQKWFGDIPRHGSKPEALPIEEVQTAQRRLVVERDVPVSIIYLAFKMADRMSREFVVCDVISDILSNGTSSRLYQNLVKENTLFSSVNAYVTGDVDPGLFVVTGRVQNGVSLEIAEEALWQQLHALDKIEDYELTKVKNKYEATNVFGEINVLNKTMNLAFFEFLGSADMINQDVEQHNSVTREEIHETASRLFRTENSNVLYYKSNGQNTTTTI